jgi:tRNA uridine 5-carboxymethylaminomethyl modification enzyme
MRAMTGQGMGMELAQHDFDVIVIGGGHAGAEAALAAARCGAQTLLLSHNLDHLAQMSCNPAIGGIAKGQLAREVDALGGAMGRVTDAATLQFRMLNRRKGPAVHSPRAQCDKLCYQRAMKRELEGQPNLAIHQAEAREFIVADGRIAAVTTQFAERLRARAYVLAAGTFLAGKLHYGMSSFPGGRAGDPPATALAEALRQQLGLRLGRLKTGTPPRVLAASIDFAALIPQPAEETDEAFSFFPDDAPAWPRTARRDLPCHLAQTTCETADIVRASLDQSPLYGGVIDGVGTRYCPSFEDKVVRFPHHETHTIYLEPEGEFTAEVYLNGISTSLPPAVQVRMVRSVPGLERAVLARYAYAIEYDFVIPDQIDRSLRTKAWENLFLAGQVNGTSGYEEAAGQGLLAGLNAARQAAGQAAIELGRETSYLGVMVDDLATKEITEPYRLFTSRAEHRLVLRHDNADLRLCPLAIDLGLLPTTKADAFRRYAAHLGQARERLAGACHEGRPLHEAIRAWQGEPPAAPLPFPSALLGLDLARAEDRRILRQLAIEAHYAGYLEREQKSIRRLRQLEDWVIPPGFAYGAIAGLRNEARAKLIRVAPHTLAQAGRIDGVTPAEINLLQIHLKRGTKGAPPPGASPPRRTEDSTTECSPE